MPRKKIKLSKEDVNAYRRNPNLKMLAARCNITVRTARTRLEELGILTPSKMKNKRFKRVFSKEFLENRKRHTEQMKRYFEKTNIEGKIHRSTILQTIGYHKR